MIKTDEVKDMNITIGDKQISLRENTIDIYDPIESESITFTKEQFVKILEVMKVIL